HLLLFFFVACCYINTATAGFREVQIGRFFSGFLAAVAYSLLIEVLQHFIPWRSFEWLDFAADALGAALGLVVCLHLQKRFEVSPIYR
ncbi:MAG TPA: VanZ family protein, partial [Candidatus Binatia bacterium]